MKQDLDRARDLADRADEITMRHYLSVDLSVQAKPDKTPVTQADLETEQALQQIVHEDFGDAYLGEEGARALSTNGRIWVVDPIDGTKNFLRGMPIWATLIALRDEAGLRAAVVSAPALGRRWWAARGEGAFTRDTNGVIRQLHVSRVARLEDAFIGYASLFSWDKVPVGTERVLRLLKAAWRNRAVGDFLNYMLIAEGAIDACLEPDPKQWDLDAPNLIVSEAGGSVWTSVAPDVLPETPRIVIASNGLLETSVRKQLNV